ncbi:MAG: hypothetical protein M3198_08680 [Actinomycetota bacterium]|nr:hypothetical protein [Actinomycetota bacterium]
MEIVLVGLGLAVVAGLWLSSRNRRRPAIKRLGPSFFFWLSLTYLGLLLAAAVMYNDPDFGLQEDIPVLVADVMPIGVPWFGALGAVMISVEGIFKHNKRWDSSYNYWHIARPLFGAVVAIVAYFLFVLIMNAADSPPAFLEGEADTGPLDYIIYFVVAFLVGYREETFRELVKRATDLILKPAESGGSGASSLVVRIGGAEVDAIDFGEVQLGGTKSLTVEILNSGSSAVESPVLTVATTAPAGLTSFSVLGDRVTSAGPLEIGSSRTTEILFKPVDQGAHTGTLTVSSPSLTSAVALEMSGVGVP